MTTTGYRTSGRVALASFLIIFTSFWHPVYGVRLLFSDNWGALATEDPVLVATSTWAWLLLLTGVLKLAAGYGLLLAPASGRVAAIVLVSLTMLEHLAVLGDHTHWSGIVIVASAIVLYALLSSPHSAGAQPNGRWSPSGDRSLRAI